MNNNSDEEDGISSPDSASLPLHDQFPPPPLLLKRKKRNINMGTALRGGKNKFDEENEGTERSRALTDQPDRVSGSQEFPAGLVLLSNAASSEEPVESPLMESAIPFKKRKSLLTDFTSDQNQGMPTEEEPCQEEQIQQNSPPTNQHTAPDRSSNEEQEGDEDEEVDMWDDDNIHYSSPKESEVQQREGAYNQVEELIQHQPSPCSGQQKDHNNASIDQEEEQGEKEREEQEPKSELEQDPKTLVEEDQEEEPVLEHEIMPEKEEDEKEVDEEEEEERELELVEEDEMYEEATRTDQEEHEEEDARNDDDNACYTFHTSQVLPRDGTICDQEKEKIQQKLPPISNQPEDQNKVTTGHDDDDEDDDREEEKENTYSTSSKMGQVLEHDDLYTRVKRRRRNRGRSREEDPMATHLPRKLQLKARKGIIKKVGMKKKRNVKYRSILGLYKATKVIPWTSSLKKRYMKYL